MNHEPSKSTQTPVTRLRETVARLGKPAGVAVVASAISEGLVFVFSHVTLEQALSLASRGWKDVLLACGFCAFLLMMRHLDQLNEDRKVVLKMFSEAIDRNQRINEQQGEVLVRVEAALMAMQQQIKALLPARDRTVTARVRVPGGGA